MTTRTWDNSVNLFTSAADWTPQGVPQPGDIAVINGGTVTAPGLLAGLNIQVTGNGTTVPTFFLADASLSSTTNLTLNNAASFGVGTPVTLNLVGRSENDGVLTLLGSVIRVNASPDANNVGGTLVNTGGFNLVNSSPQVFASSGSATIENDGSFSVWNASNTFQEPVFAAAVTGTGVIVLTPNGRLDLSQAVGSGQTFRFDGGASAGSVLQIDSSAAFQGSISGFSSGDAISLTNTPENSFTYTSTDATHGVLSILNGSTVIASLGFAGSYSQSSFNVATTVLSNNTVTTTITTTANQAQHFSYTDTALGGLSATSAGLPYTGSAGLSNQMTWSSADSVAIAANGGSSDIVGGSASDGLQALGGVNVLDGEGGSNFFVGGTGAGSQDYFYMDGRAGATWDTIVNFHSGDQAVLYGFNVGVSTLVVTPSDGAAGYTGVTIHSELNGAGTGFNGSITFAGVSLATEQSNFHITSGSANGIGFLQVNYS